MNRTTETAPGRRLAPPSPPADTLPLLRRWHDANAAAFRAADRKHQAECAVSMAESAQRGALSILARIARSAADGPLDERDQAARDAALQKLADALELLPVARERRDDLTAAAIQADRDFKALSQALGIADDVASLAQADATRAAR